MKMKTIAAIGLGLYASLAPAWAKPYYEFDFFETRGSAYERGLQHGRHFQAEIRKDFEEKSGWAYSVPLQYRRPEIVASFLRQIRALPEGQELIDEMQGIAEGSGRPFTDIAALNVTFDLGDREACSMAIMPETADGPIIVDTLDDYPSGKFQRNYPSFVQVAYPTKGHALVFLCNYGAVFAHHGLNDAGLAMGATSGGIGAPRGGANYDGVYQPMLSRYALQFMTNAEDVIALYTAHRQLTKCINVTVVDDTGRGAVLEYGSSVVGVRRVDPATKRPIWATNHVLSDKFPPYTPDIERYGYMINSRARYRRFEQLFAGAPALDLAYARRILTDAKSGEEGPICQDNHEMVTTTGYLYASRLRTAQLYLGRPDLSTPRTVKLDPAQKPATGAPAPANAQVQQVLQAQPLKMGLRYVRYEGGFVTGVNTNNGTFTFKTAQGTQLVAQVTQGSRVAVFAPAALGEIPADSRTDLRGRGDTNTGRFVADRLVTFRPPIPWDRIGGGRFGHGLNEASGLITQPGGKLLLKYKEDRPPVTVALATNGQAYVAYMKNGQIAEVRPHVPVDVFGAVLFDGDPVHVSWTTLYVDAAEARRLKLAQEK